MEGRPLLQKDRAMRGKEMIGVNYWPIDSAMDWWRRFDERVVEEDFARIRETGLEGVRLFLLWEDFQPHPQKISSRSLDRLVRVMEIGHSKGLRLIPTLFTGHMSGMNYLPLWMLELKESEARFPVFSDGKKRRNGIRNFYADRELIAAQKRLVREVSGALQGHPGLWAWDLGNEPSNLVLPPGKEEALRWLEEMVTELKKKDESIPVTIGLHQEDLEEDRQMGPKEVAAFCELISMHAYSIYAQWSDDPFDVDVIPFLGLLTQWLGSKEVLIEEVGLPSSNQFTEGIIVSEDRAFDYYEQLFARLSPYSFSGLFLWCYGDYAKSLWKNPPFDEKKQERYFGLFREDRSPKSFVPLLKWVKCERGHRPISFDWMDIEPDEYYRAPQTHLTRLFRRFKEGVVHG